MSKKYSVTLTLRDVDYSFANNFRCGNYYYYECNSLRQVNEYLHSRLCLSKDSREIVGILIEEFKEK